MNQLAYSRLVNTSLSQPGRAIQLVQEFHDLLIAGSDNSKLQAHYRGPGGASPSSCAATYPAALTRSRHQAVRELGGELPCADHTFVTAQRQGFRRHAPR
ncbi:hypothetical protein ACWD4J_41620 [Streptomyces sp. NPDC002577]